jgi:ligand-binding sensor domain-containing protein
LDVPSSVVDAIRWDADRLLIGTDDGLLLWNHRTDEGKWLEAAKGRYVMGRDLLGRLWLGTDTLWLANSAQDILPLTQVDSEAIPKRRIVDLAADPVHPDGIIAALGPYGWLSVRVPEDAPH